MQFHWDREGQADDKTSCWLRVSSAWAGAHYGGIAIPRIGMEVLVSFLEGDPDQPTPTAKSKPAPTTTSPSASTSTSKSAPVSSSKPARKST